MSNALAWLLTYALHSTSAFALAWIATRLVTSPSLRARLWKSAIAAPLLTSLIAFNWGAALSMQRTAAVVQLGAPRAEAPVATNVVAKNATPAEPVPRRMDIVEWPRVILGAYCAIAALLLLRLALQVRAFRRAARGEVCEDLMPVLRELSDRPLKLFVSDAIGIPVAIGSATIAIPRRALTLTPAEQRVLLGHELAHLIRRDPLWLLAIATIEALLFFQPLLVIARRRLTEATELVADEMAVQMTHDGLSLARCLASVAGWNAARPAAHAAAITPSSSQLVMRVARLLDSSTTKRSRLAIAALPILLIATAALPAVRFVSDDALRALFAEAAKQTPDHPDPTFNAPARSAWVLDVTRGREIVPVLIEKLRDRDWIVREHATWALDVARDARAVDALLGALGDDAWRVRGGAASALGSIGDARAAPALMPLLDDEHWQVRVAAVKSLGELASDRATIDRLRPMIEDAHVAVRNQIPEAIEQIERRLESP